MYYYSPRISGRDFWRAKKMIQFEGDKLYDLIGGCRYCVAANRYKVIPV